MFALAEGAQPDADIAERRTLLAASRGVVLVTGFELQAQVPVAPSAAEHERSLHVRAQQVDARA